MPTTFLNGISIHYLQLGRGPDVILVHGLATNLAFWGLAIAPLLSRHFRVTLFDLRGHGHTSMPLSGYSSREMVGDMHALFEHLGLSQVHLVGHSFGGKLILSYAIAHRPRVLSLTLADAVVPALFPAAGLAGGRVRVLATHGQPDHRARLLARERTAADSVDLLTDLAAVTRNGAEMRSAANGWFVPFALWNGRGAAGPQWRQLVETTTALAELKADEGATVDDLRTIGQPVLLLFGERSRYRPLGRALRGMLSNSTFVIVPKAGHFYPLLKPKLFADRVLAFLHGLAGTATA
jgi:pimeloyl-ACP methyl ester carboxylesterase